MWNDVISLFSQIVAEIPLLFFPISVSFKTNFLEFSKNVLSNSDSEIYSTKMSLEKNTKSGSNTTMLSIKLSDYQFLPPVEIYAQLQNSICAGKNKYANTALSHFQGFSYRSVFPRNFHSHLKCWLEELLCKCQFCKNNSESVEHLISVYLRR